MPRFYFDIEDASGLTVDETGLDLPDLVAAEREAKLTLAEIAYDTIPIGESTMLKISIRMQGDGTPSTIVVDTRTEREQGTT